MASFKDTNGKQWTISLDAPTIRTIRQELDGLDLADLEGKAYERLVKDPCLLVDTLWLLCREQAEKLGLTDVQFGRSLVGDAIERATAAMLEAIADFFPPSHRELVTCVAGKNNKLREIGIAKAIQKLSDPDLEKRAVDALEARMEAEITRSLTQLTFASSSPGSSASTPEG